MKNGRIEGIYAVTAETQDTTGLLARVEAAMKGGVRLFQYRDKHSPLSFKRAQCAAIIDCIQGAGAKLIVNDDPQLAADVGADGVHVGDGDASIAYARSVVGGGRIIGVSCYNDLGRARLAQEAGADYVAFGSFFPSVTKPGAVRAGLELLRQGSAELNVPIVAIGGIGQSNMRQLVEAGADALAIVSALFGADDIEQAARVLTNMYGKSKLQHQH